jgi:hypothetical protein
MGMLGKARGMIATNVDQIVIGETKNIESSDLVVSKGCSLGRSATEMQILRSNVPRLLIAAETGQCAEIRSLSPPAADEDRYSAIEARVQSLCRFHSRLSRTVMVRSDLFALPRAIILDLVETFMKLDEGALAAILRTAGRMGEDAHLVEVPTIKLFSEKARDPELFTQKRCLRWITRFVRSLRTAISRKFNPTDAIGASLPVVR